MTESTGGSRIVQLVETRASFANSEPHLDPVYVLMAPLPVGGNCRASRMGVALVARAVTSTRAIVDCMVEMREY